MFGLVRAARLTEALEEAIELRSELLSVRRHVSSHAETILRQESRIIQESGARAIAEAEVKRLTAELQKTEAERKELFAIVTDRAVIKDEPQQEETAQPRTLSGIEVVTRAMNVRQRRHQGIA